MWEELFSVLFMSLDPELPPRPETQFKHQKLLVEWMDQKHIYWFLCCVFDTKTGSGEHFVKGIELNALIFALKEGVFYGRRKNLHREKVKLVT